MKLLARAVVDDDRVLYLMYNDRIGLHQVMSSIDLHKIPAYRYECFFKYDYHCKAHVSKEAGIQVTWTYFDIYTKITG